VELRNQQVSVGWLFFPIQ